MGDKEPRPKYLHIRLTEEDEAVVSQLTGIYQLDRTMLIRLAIRHILETRPTFKVVPQP